MLEVLTLSISTVITRILRPYLGYIPSSVSWVCPHCGFATDVRRVDGTSLSSWSICCVTPNGSPYRHVVEVTDTGKLSISCDPWPSAETDRLVDSGADVQTYSTPTNFRKARTRDYWRARGIEGQGGQSCGCDPKIDYLCKQHADDFEQFVTLRES